MSDNMINVRSIDPFLPRYQNEEKRKYSKRSSIEDIFSGVSQRKAKNVAEWKCIKNLYLILFRTIIQIG